MRSFLLVYLIIPLTLFAQPSGNYRDAVIRLNAIPEGPEKINSYQLLITEVQGQDPELARKLINQLANLSEKIKSPQGMAWSNYQQGFYFNMKGEYDSLRTHAIKCLEISRQNDLPQTEASGYHLLATYYWQTGKFDEAVKNHFNSLKIREKLKDTAGIGSSLSSLGVVSLSNNKLDKAKTYNDRAYQIGRQLKDDKLILRSLHTRANIFGTEGNYKEALAADYEALKIVAKTGNRRNYSEIYSNMALCFYYMGDYDASLKYHHKVLQIDQFFGDDKQIGDTFLNLASVHTAKKDYPEAIKLLNKSIFLFKKTDYKFGLKNAYESLSKTYEGRGDFKNALLASRNYMKVAAELSNENNDKNIARLSIQYETDKKEQQIRELNQRSTIQQLQIERRNFIIAIVAGLLAVTGMGGYLLFNRRNLMEKARLQELENRQQRLSAKAVFDAEEEERRRIAAELHDGVGQVLSCALMNLNNLFTSLSFHPEQAALAANTQKLITESYDEMRSISHRMIPATLAKNGLPQALHDLVSKVQGNKLDVKLDVEGLRAQLDPITETALYRVVQEAINNVIRHAGATKLFLTLASDDDGIFLTIEDNGLGFNPADLERFKGIGIKNIQSRIEFLKGSVEFESSPGKGTLLLVSLPA